MKIKHPKTGIEISARSKAKDVELDKKYYIKTGTSFALAEFMGTNNGGEFAFSNSATTFLLKRLDSVYIPLKSDPLLNA